jgi:NADPH:quinone reductase
MRVKAARLVEHGRPLRVEEVDLAELGPRDVIVDIAYAGVNPVEMYAAQGRVAADAPVPRTLGTEAFDRIRQRGVRGKIVLAPKGR